jgi:hypothetical protein
VSAALVVMAPRWTEQPALPPSQSDRRLVTPSARAYLRAQQMTVEDLGTSTGAVRLADVVAHAAGLGRTRAEPSSTLDPAPTVVSERLPVPEAVQGHALSGRISVTAVIEGAEALELRVARLLRAAAGALRHQGAGEPVAASVITVVGGGTAGSAGPYPVSAEVTIDDVWSLQAEGLASRIARGVSADTGSNPRPRLVVADATRLDVDRFEPNAGAEVVVAVAKPQARVVPLTRSDGTQGIAIRDVSEIVVTYRDAISPALASQVAADSAEAFATAVTT